MTRGYDKGMFRYIAALCVLSLSYTILADGRKIPVSVMHSGADEMGLLFAESIKRELSHSTEYELRFAHGINPGFNFTIELVTVEAGTSPPEQIRRSAVSVVVEEMGLPNGYPVPNMWYHKLFFVEKASVDSMAKRLLQDMDARWCQYLKNSVGGCPKETLFPQEFAGR